MGCGQLLSMVIGGAIIGIIAKAITPGGDATGWFWTPIIGIAGSFLGGYLSTMFGGKQADGKIQPAGILMSIVGAVICLLIWRFTIGR
jgi:uncharacterized membrane protein YeaQ/YmgE (transglycosylase-associated protein family)